MVFLVSFNFKIEDQILNEATKSIRNKINTVLVNFGSYDIFPHILESKTVCAADMRLLGYSKVVFGSQSSYLDRLYINHIQQPPVIYYTLNFRINL